MYSTGGPRNQKENQKPPAKKLKEEREKPKKVEGRNKLV